MSRTRPPASIAPGNRSFPGSRRRRLYGSTAIGGVLRLALCGVAGLLQPAIAAAQNLPSGGVVSAGAASISGDAGTLTINQTSQNAAINWQSFGIGKDNAVVFVQPGRDAVALNRVLGSDPSAILGSLTANGEVFLVNPNGILFGKGAQVNVGGLVASTLGISDADFMAGHYAFSGSGGTVLNDGAINADGGYVALLGASVGNDGVIQARFGTIALAAGEAMTLDVAGDGLLNISIDKGAVNALVRNGGLLRADGGQVMMTAQAAGQLLKTAVNNTGVIQARTLEMRGGRIILLGDMQSGTTEVAGVLDASASDGGDGGFIETSAATVNVAGDARITTASATGTTGTWLIDPQDFTIGNGGNIRGSTLAAMLVTNSVVISTLPGPDATVPGTPPVRTLGTTAPGNGDINVNEAVAWTAAPSTTTLTLTATRDVNINAPLTATNGNIVTCCGRDTNVNAAVTTTNGSILFSAGHDVNLNGAGSNPVNLALVGTITTTDGNLTICAGNDVLVNGAITVTRSTTIPAQSLGLTPGMTLISGNAGNGPGRTGGTVIFAPLNPPVTVTAAAVSINYNPASYSAPTDYLPNFTLTEGASLAQHMLLYPTASKVADGTTAVTLDSFKTTVASGLPVGVTLAAGPGSSATFDSAEPGGDIGITYSGYGLTGPNAGQYALAVACCAAPIRTSGAITPAPVVTPPVVVPPVDVPPVVVPPVVDVPPVVVPPVITPPVDVPPVVVPPVVFPPVVTPPVVTRPVDVSVIVPPGVTPPVVTPPGDVPVVVPPVVVPPVVTPPVTTPPVVTPPVVVPIGVPPIVTQPMTTPQVEAPLVAAPGSPAMAIASSNATLAANGGPAVPAVLVQVAELSVLGTGVSLPAGQLSEAQLAQLVHPVIVEQPRPLEARVAPVIQPRLPAYPPKQDRN